MDDAIDDVIDFVQRWERKAREPTARDLMADDALDEAIEGALSVNLQLAMAQRGKRMDSAMGGL